jgi:hypothetical protein
LAQRIELVGLPPVPDEAGLKLTRAHVAEPKA